MEKETLEEAAEKRIPTSTKVWDLTETRRSDFKAGAKWQAEKNELRLKHKKALLDNCEKCLEMRIKQAERMYSEEEVFNICRAFATFVMRKGPSYKKQQDWFEQFKKK